MEQYDFIYQLHIHGEYLFDELRNEYEFSLNVSSNSMMIENFSEDLRDATFYLCLQLEKDGLMPKDLDYQLYDWFECYDQGRDALEFPDRRVELVLDYLKENGYLNEYILEIEESQPILSSGYPHEVYVLNLDYKNNKEITAHIRELLKAGIFGTDTGSIHSYALINIDEDDADILHHLVNDEKGMYLSLEDETGTGMIFNLSPEQIVKIVSRFDLDAFIFGIDYIPSVPYLYKKKQMGSYQFTKLDEIYSIDDLESIASSYSDVWKDLCFNDYFRESLWNNTHFNWC